MIIAIIVGMCCYIIGLGIGYHICRKVKNAEIDMLRNALEGQIKQRIWENLYWELRQRIAKRVHYMNEKRR